MHAHKHSMMQVASQQASKLDRQAETNAPERVVVHGCDVRKEHFNPRLECQRLIAQVPVVLLAGHHMHSDAKAVTNCSQRELQCITYRASTCSRDNRVR
jgi:hypothetical protein